MIAFFFWAYMINACIFFFSAQTVLWTSLDNETPEGAKILLALSSLGFILGTKGISALSAFL